MIGSDSRARVVVEVMITCRVMLMIETRVKNGGQESEDALVRLDTVSFSKGAGDSLVAHDLVDARRTKIDVESDFGNVDLWKESENKRESLGEASRCVS